jgi:hypothetical protein
MESLADKFKFDKSAFQILSHAEADAEMINPFHTDSKERWAYLHYLKARAYGFDPDVNLPFDRTSFEIIKRKK